jgi:hypothetical protein
MTGGPPGSIPGTAGVGASHDTYNHGSSNYYSNNFGVTGGLSGPGGQGRP